MRNRQVGPDHATDALAALIPRITYKPGWTFDLREIERGQGCEGLTQPDQAEEPAQPWIGAPCTDPHFA